MTKIYIILGAPVVNLKGQSMIVSSIYSTDYFIAAKRMIMSRQVALILTTTPDERTQKRTPNRRTLNRSAPNCTNRSALNRSALNRSASNRSTLKLRTLGLPAPHRLPPYRLRLSCHCQIPLTAHHVYLIQ